VHYLKTVHRKRSFRQSAGVIRILLGENLRGPQGSRACDRVEPFQIVQAGTGFIVVSAHHGGAIGANPFDAAIRIGAIADKIAAAERLIEAAGGICLHRVKRFPVRMDVAQDQVAHGRG